MAIVAGKNPFDGFTPSVPQGFKLDYGSEEFQHLEDEGQSLLLALHMPLEDCGSQALTHQLTHAHTGAAAAKHAAFVLVAGGLGERLGYSGIKVKLPVDSARSVSFLQVPSLHCAL